MNNTTQIQHLYLRAGFGMTLPEFQKQSNKSRQSIVKEIFDDSALIEQLKVVDKYEPPIDKKELITMTKEERQALVKEMVKESKNLIKDLNIKWIDKMYQSKAQLREKMTFFWHGHFACQSLNVFFVQQQNNILRKHALGKFGDLLLDIAKDPAMLLFLNNQQNKKQKPNENFARELMELFSIGIGNYTENDIKESARAFTGWTVDKQTGAYDFNEKAHDYESKTFMGQTGNFNGEDIIKIILQNPKTAEYITTKIYKFFVNDQVDTGNVRKLANNFFKSGYDIGKLMAEIFNADWFYDDKNIGVKIKSPIELLISMQKNFNLKFVDDTAPLFIQKVLGQVLFYPPNVAGWAGGRNWIDSSTLMFRLKMPELFFKAAEIAIDAKDDGDVNTKSLVNNQLKKFQAEIDWAFFLGSFSNEKSPELLYTKISDYLLQTASKPSKEFIGQFVDNTSQENLIKSLTLAIATLPEYQLC